MMLRLCRCFFGTISGQLFVGLDNLAVFFTDKRHNVIHSYASVSNGSVKVIRLLKGFLFRQGSNQAGVFFFRKMHPVPADGFFQFNPAFFNIFFPPFFLKPGTDFRPCATGLNNFQPVTGRTFVRVRRAQNFHNFTGFDLIVQRHNPAIYLGANHAVSNLGMNGIGKVNNGRSCRNINDVSFGCKNKYIVRDKIIFNGFYNFLYVICIFLVFQQTANPDNLLFKPGAAGLVS